MWCKSSMLLGITAVTFASIACTWFHDTHKKHSVWNTSANVYSWRRSVFLWQWKECCESCVHFFIFDECAEYSCWRTSVSLALQTVGAMHGFCVCATVHPTSRNAKNPLCIVWWQGGGVWVSRHWTNFCHFLHLKIKWRCHGSIVGSPRQPGIHGRCKHASAHVCTFAMWFDQKWGWFGGMFAHHYRLSSN